MKLFTFIRSTKAIKHIDENGWVFNAKCKGKLGWFSLRTPVMKEITYSKGPTVRDQKHVVYGIGLIHGNRELRGIALFDPQIRLLMSMAICVGVAYAAMKVYSGVIWAFLFYILVSFLSAKDDDYFLHCCKLMYEV